MGTRNFAYENRCIVVTGEDCECRNLPEFGDWSNDRRYSSAPLSHNFDWLAVQPIITTAYYSGACIDYEVKEYDDVLDELHDYLVENLESAGLSWFITSRIVDEISEETYQELYDEILEQEVKEVNEFLDDLKEEYKYQEYTCVATASNGEAFYEKVGE